MAGPAHISLRDLGLTYATTTAQGVCVTFREPVRGIDPLGAIRHPSLTVTVADPQGLVHALGNPSTDVDADASDARTSVRQRLTHGALAGATATTAMSAAMLPLQRLGRSQKLPPRAIAERVVSPLRRAPEPMARGSAAAGHVAFGTAAGALFGLAAPRLAGPGWFRGVSFATGLMLVSYEGWVPAARVLPSLHRQSTARQASLVVGHLVYGVVLGRLAG